MSNQNCISVRYCEDQFFTVGSYTPVFTPASSIQAAEYLRVVRAAEAAAGRKLTVSELTRIGDLVNAN